MSSGPNALAEADPPPAAGKGACAVPASGPVEGYVAMGYVDGVLEEDAVDEAGEEAVEDAEEGQSECETIGGNSRASE